MMRHPVQAALVAMALACPSLAQAVDQPKPGAPVQADGAPAVPPVSPAPKMSYEQAVEAGRRALDSKDNDAAVAAYDAALEARPDSAAAAFNRGVALYRAGRFKEAAEAFRDSGAKASSGERTSEALEKSSTFNRAASYYGATKAQAEAAERMLAEARQGGKDAPAAAADPQVNPAELKQAIDDAKASFDAFRDAAYGDDADLESRANAEQARRLVKALEELRKQQEERQKQQQKQEQQDKQEQQENKDKQQQQQQQQQDGQQQQQQDQHQQQDGSDEQPKDQSKPDDGSKNEQQKQDASKDEQKPKEQQSEDQQPKEQPPQDAGSPQDSAKQDDAKGAPAAERGDMTKDEADRLLQGVRDRERRRRAEQQRREQDQAARGRKPIKDW